MLSASHPIFSEEYERLKKEYKKQKEEFEKKAKNLQDRAATLGTNLENVKTDLAHQQKLNMSEKQANELIEKEIGTLKIKLDQRDVTIADLQKDINHIKGQIGQKDSEIEAILAKAQEACDEKIAKGKEIQRQIDERDRDFQSLYDFDRFDMQFYGDGIKLFSGLEK